jgi:hypothetical protein
VPPTPIEAKGTTVAAMRKVLRAPFTGPLFSCTDHSHTLNPQQGHRDNGTFNVALCFCTRQNSFQAEDDYDGQFLLDMEFGIACDREDSSPSVQTRGCPQGTSPDSHKAYPKVLWRGPPQEGLDGHNDAHNNAQSLALSHHFLQRFRSLTLNVCKTHEGIVMSSIARSKPENDAGL